MRYCFLGHETVGAYVAARLDQAGFTVAGSLSTADVVISYCTSQTRLEDAYFEEDGVVNNVAAHTLLVDLSPSTPQFARELAAVAMVSHLDVVEAPCTVLNPCIPQAFAYENTTCFLSGDARAKERAHEVLKALFSTVQDVGEAGAASMAHAAFVIQSSASMVAAVEADALYRAVRAMPAGLGQAAAGRPGTLVPTAEALLESAEGNQFEGSYSIEMLMGEVTAALSTAEEADIVLPQLEGVMQLLEMVAVIGGASKQPAALAVAYREQGEVEELGFDFSRAQDYAAHDHDHGFDDDGFDPEEDFDDFDYEMDDDMEFCSMDEEGVEVGDCLDDEGKEPVSAGLSAASDEEDYGFEDDDPGYDFATERVEEYADFEDDDFLD
ncbi:MAG: NAD(P)-dependent oxidoreductase [Coriobacteriia bacterium]|nr:NAD(P)-dependent oxidoreductase [Coriobacteriia bacterium]